MVVKELDMFVLLGNGVTAIWLVDCMMDGEIDGAERTRASFPGLGEMMAVTWVIVMVDGLVLEIDGDS